MRKVLLISYYYPPRPNIGGLRPHALAKHLPHYGWEAVVLTPGLPNVQRSDPGIIETDYRDVLQDFKAKLGLNPKATLHDQLGLSLASKRDSKRVHTRTIDWLKRWVAYPDFAKGWIPFANEAVAAFARREKVDAILTTSPPESVNLIGARAKAILRVPWIADFRDLWTQNLGAPDHISQPLRVRLEKKVLRSADALVTVSGPWRDRLAARYAGKPIYTIANGFDPDDFKSRPAQLTSHFSITYAGQLYQGKRDPSPLLEVLGELIQQQLLPRDDVRVRFYGPPEPWLPALVAGSGLQGVVELHNVVGREEALQREMESQILLLLGWSDPRETGQHTGKLFEYLGAGRPILAVGGHRGVLTEVLDETRAGIHALSKAQLRESLMAMYREFKESGRVRYHADPEAVEQYSHRQMALKFADVLESTAKPSSEPASAVEALSASPH